MSLDERTDVSWSPCTVRMAVDGVVREVVIDEDGTLWIKQTAADLLERRPRRRVYVVESEGHVRVTVARE